MNKTKTIYFLSAIVCIIGCYALNLSYSLFVQTETKSVVDATVPSLSYSLETSEFTIPANSGEVVKLKVINSGTADIKYGISIAETNDATIQLVEIDDNNIVGELKASTTGETTSKEVLVYVTNLTDSDITLTFNLTAKYNTLNFDEDFIVTSNIDCVNTIKLLKDAIIARANSITESDSKTKGYAMYSDTLRTTPAEEISEADESLLLTTEDDYTITTELPSYYFRGNVEDNYVTFADMCWRIVRINGDGSIKLILEDQNQPCSTSINGDWGIPTTTGGSTYTGNFGYTQYNKNTLTASDGTQNSGTKYIMDYLHGQTNSASSMATAFKNFQSTFTETELSKLKSGNWCLGDTGYSRTGSSNSDYTYTLLNETQMMDNKIKGTSFYYDSYVRLSGENKDGFQPTLKCNGTIMNDWDDDTTNPTPMYVGGITADEMVYAGATDAKNNVNFYIMNDSFYNGELDYYLFWSLSPYDFYSTYDRAFYLYYDGYVDYYFVNNYGAFRPAVSLASSAVITSGEGTLDSPYQIG